MYSSPLLCLSRLNIALILQDILTPFKAPKCALVDKNEWKECLEHLEMMCWHVWMHQLWTKSSFSCAVVGAVGLWDLWSCHSLSSYGYAGKCFDLTSEQRECLLVCIIEISLVVWLNLKTGQHSWTVTPVKLSRTVIRRAVFWLWNKENV